MTTRLPPAAAGSPSLPKYVTLYVLLAGIGGGLFFAVVVLYCCKICMGRRLSLDYIISRENTKDGGEGAGREQHGTTTGNANSMSTTENNGGPEKKACVVQYSGGGTQIVMAGNHVDARCSSPLRSDYGKGRRRYRGGLQRKTSDDHPGLPSLSRSPRDTDSFKRCSSSGGQGDDLHYRTSTTPHSPHYHNATVISIEPMHSRGNISQSSSSSSLQQDHQSTQNSELPSPRSPRSRHNSGGSSLSRCGSRGSTARENRTSMKSIPSRTSSFRRPVGGSLKDSKVHSRRTRGGSTGDSYLTINPESSPRRSVSLRSPRHTHSRSPQSKDGNLLPFGFNVGSENSVHAAKERDYKKFNPSPTMSTHSVISGQWTPLEAGLDWWTRKHKMQLVQHENIEEKASSGGKVRYNDVGSLEDVRITDVSDYIFLDSNEDSETATMEVQPQQIKHQYRALWELRATLEEEDWAAANNPPKIQRMPGGPSLSPTVPPKEDTQALLASSVSYSTEQSPDRDALSSHTTSFESNTEPILVEDHGQSGNMYKDVFHHLGPTSSASLAARRQSYKNVLHNRMKRLERSASIKQETGNVTETTTSFDSIETQESTSTDTSRLEAMTTSLDSTDNTDSTGEGQSYQQHLNKFQFRLDSGYKSFENGSSGKLNTSNPNLPVRLLPRRCLSSGSSVDAGVAMSQIKQQPSSGSPAVSRGNNNQRSDDSQSSAAVFARMGQLPPPPSRSIARKRRDFGRFERHSIGSLDSVREPLDEESGGSMDSSSSRGAKGSLFYRYFRNPRSNSAYYTRDYSIDEKSDQLFREFSRCDPAFDVSPFPSGSTSPNRQSQKIYSRRNSSARTTASFDLGTTSPRGGGGHPPTSPGPYTGGKSLQRRGSQHENIDDELPLLVSDPSSPRLIASSRFVGSGHTSIPIITVDDS